MRSLGVVAADELGGDRSQVPLVNDDKAIQALAAERPDHPFRDGIRPGCADRAEQHLDAEAPGPQREVATVHRVPVP